MMGEDIQKKSIQRKTGGDNKIGQRKNQVNN